jgi:hypothetical protein
MRKRLPGSLIERLWIAYKVMRKVVKDNIQIRERRIQ